MNLIAAVLSMPETLQLHLHRCVSASVRQCVSASVRQWAWNLISPDRGVESTFKPPMHFHEIDTTACNSFGEDSVPGHHAVGIPAVNQGELCSAHLGAPAFAWFGKQNRQSSTCLCSNL